MARTRRRRGSHSRLLVAASLVLIVAGGAVGAVSTGAFTAIDADRGVNVGVSNDPRALLGLDIAASVTANTQDRLVTVTNNMNSRATVTISLQPPGGGTLRTTGQHGSTLSLSLAPGASATVDVVATPRNSLAFTVAARADGATVTATRTVDVKVSVIPIDIDIKPGSDTNPINPDSAGVTPVAILNTSDFDPRTVDVSSLRFGDPDDVTLDNGAGATVAHGGHFEDVDGDGDQDLLLHFPTRDAGFDDDDASGTLVGRTNDGSSIRGSDSVTIVGGGSDGGDGRGNGPGG